MKIKLHTGYEYDLTNPNARTNLKKNISTLTGKNKLAELRVIFDQVAPYKDYKGTDAAYLSALSIYRFLCKYVRQLVPPAPTPDALVPLNQPLKTHHHYGETPKAAIVIPLRDAQGRRMHAAFFDHYVVRKITAHNTLITKKPTQSVSSFSGFIQTTTLELSIDVKDFGKKLLPESTDDLNTSGLLFIPGRAKDDNDMVRREHELQLIKSAKRHGQPILAICAGSWQLWESYGGKTKDVKDHCYANMPYILTNGSVGNNRDIHGIDIISGSLLANIISTKNLGQLPLSLKVNSVHWQAPDESSIPSALQISATSKNDPSLSTKSRQGGDNKMNPTEGSIEAFECKYGAPILGIQWHPEAYFKTNNAMTAEDKSHIAIVQYMAKAGDAYQAKRKMMTELLGKCGMFGLQKPKRPTNEFNLVAHFKALAFK